MNEVDLASRDSRDQEALQALSAVMVFRAEEVYLVAAVPKGQWEPADSQGTRRLPESAFEDREDRPGRLDRRYIYIISQETIRTVI